MMAVDCKSVNRNIGSTYTELGSELFIFPSYQKKNKTKQNKTKQNKQTNKNTHTHTHTHTKKNLPDAK